MMRTLLLMAAILMPAPSLAERTWGLVIGIDDYAFIPDLHGAVNDAEDIADALRGLGARVTLLTDGAATRAAILGAWDNILAKADPGDRLIVTYAGHGSNEPEHSAGSEDDGRDENFLLAGFAPRGASAAERIRDDEIADLLERSAALEVIFVADACHSGTVTRDLKPALGYRYVEPQTLEADPLPPPPPPSGSEEGQDQIALFLAAVNEAEKVPEVLIDGTPRGALSYAFAAGLRGEADLDGDRSLTKGELETFVRRTVRQVSDGVQLPQSAPAGRESHAIIALSDLTGARPPAPFLQLSFSDLPPVAVGAVRDWAGTSGIEPALHGALRRDGIAVFSSVGDRIATATTPGDLQAVVDKARLIAALRRMDTSPLSIGFDRGDRVHEDGQSLLIGIDGRRTAHLTLLNLGADGTITFLYPHEPLGDPISAPASRRVEVPVVISAPFGADHVVAVETDGPAPSLLRSVSALEGTRNMDALWDVLRSSGGRLSVFPFFTARKAL